MPADYSGKTIKSKTFLREKNPHLQVKEFAEKEKI